MKNKLFLLLFFSSFIVAAQNVGKQLEKLDGQLKLWIAEPSIVYKEHKALFKTGPVADPVIEIIFKTAGANPASLIKKYNGKLFSVIGTICTAEIPLSQIAAFATESDILKIESSKEIQLNNDKAKQLIGADKVHSDSLPNGKSYTGKGVIVGIVDSGIDFLHPDFRKKDDSTQTRILSMWDQTVHTGTKPSGFTYGSEWTQAQVNAELINLGTVTLRDSLGHGTHVTGTAAGLRGMAYDADIITVKTPLVSNGDYTFTTSSKTLDAVNYVYQKAAALNKPCVVNMSLGFAFGAPHDGTSLFEQGLDYLVTNGNSFIVCASAGNDGRSFAHHGGYNLTSDSVWTYINGLNGATWYQVNNSQFDDSLFISVEVDSANVSFTGLGILNQTKIFQTPWLKIKDIKDAAGGLSYPVLYANGDTASIVRIVATSYDTARTEVYIYPRDNFIVNLDQISSVVNLYKIAFKGKGSFHSWVQPLYGLGVAIANFNGQTNARYTSSDNIYCIGIPATAKKVLAVGAFINKKSYVDILGRTQLGLNTNNLSVGAIASFSSVGPTLDGRIKPEFCAPGLNVASSLSRYAKKDSSQMIDANTIVYSGTSMSCPVTVGALALYFEQNPHATFDQIRGAIDSSVTRDAFVKGAIPNNTWGYGKLNIFRATSEYSVGINEVDELDQNKVSVFPNPASNSIRFAIKDNIQEGKISVFDINGKLINEMPLKNNQQDMDVSNWRSGMYFYRIEGNKNDILSGKFLIQ